MFVMLYLIRIPVSNLLDFFMMGLLLEREGSFGIFGHEDGVRCFCVGLMLVSALSTLGPKQGGGGRG
jgi:hypothetical protein